jgi:hypothetical protein
VTFEKEYVLRCATAEWIARNGCALRWCHRAVGRKIEETVGFPEWNVQFSVWLTTGKNSSEPCAIVCQNCAIYSVFPSGMTSHSKIDQLDWECISALRKIWKMQWNFTHGCTTCVTKLDIFSIRNTYMLNTSKYNSAKRLLATSLSIGHVANDKHMYNFHSFSSQFYHASWYYQVFICPNECTIRLF